MAISLQVAQKLWAAFVMVGILAVILAVWHLDAAGRSAVGTACDLKDLQPRIELCQGRVSELFRDPANVCLVKGMDAQLAADWFFLLSYGPLNFAIFLFVLTQGRTSPGLARILLIFGALLTVAMVAGDISENATLHRLIHRLVSPAPGPIPGSVVKWGSLAVASATLGVLYLLPPVRPARVIVALTAFGAAALPVWGLAKDLPEYLPKALIAQGIFWLAVLIHAIAVATAAPQAIPSVQPVAKETAK